MRKLRQQARKKEKTAAREPETMAPREQSIKAASKRATDNGC